MSLATSTPHRTEQILAGPCRPFIVLTLLSATVVAAGCRVLPWQNMLPDFICYWTAAQLVAAGHSPYDPQRQARIQQDLGWDEATHGLGLCRFLPYYYPPWLALPSVLLLPLGFQAAKVAWFFLNVQLALLAGYLLRGAVPGVPPRVPLILVPVFAFTVVALLLGQTSILILFLMVATWRLLESRRDHLAGYTLAWLTLKPQLTGLLVLAILLWGVRRRRGALLRGFGMTLATLCLVSCFVVPAWPFQVLNAPQETPPPTTLHPALGNSWFLVCKTAGLRGWALGSLYLVVALTFALAVLKAALAPTDRLTDLFALATLAAFFVAPYTRHYDFPVLLIPALACIGSRLSDRAGALLVASLVALPYAQFLLLRHFRPADAAATGPLPEYAFFWVPLLLTILWLGATRPRLRRPDRGCHQMKALPPVSCNCSVKDC